MEELLRLSMRGHATAKPATEKEEKMLKHAQHAKAKVELYKCIKWVQECISKFRKTVIHVKVREKSLRKALNAKNAKEKSIFQLKKSSKCPFRKELRITIQSLWLVKAIK